MLVFLLSAVTEDAKGYVKQDDHRRKYLDRFLVDLLRPSVIVGNGIMA